jgi:hypothetical protein
VHRASQHILGLLPGNPRKGDALGLRLSTFQADELKEQLLVDAQSYYYSALISFLDASLGLDRHLYSWSTVKLYYSVFYSLRCLLAISGYCIYYCNEKPFTCRAMAGTTGSMLKGTTHKVVLSLFEQVFRSDPLLSQDIAGEPALKWLINRREDANYKQARFTDPSPPAHFVRVNDLGFRRAINAYLDDKTSLYVFDQDHAMVAFPLATLVRARVELKIQNLPYADLESNKFLSGLGRDKSGRIACLAQLF